MICTVQTNSLSGSFASPWGTDVRITDLRGAYDLLRDWADEHDRIGAEPTDAHMLVWRGAHDDVTDLYPDWELTIGPRGGIRRQPC
jgi:hypothetical protein